MNRADFMARVSTRLGRAGSPALPEAASIVPRPPRTSQAARAERVAQFALELARVGGAAHVFRSSSALELGLIEFVHGSLARRLVAFGKREFDRFGFERFWRQGEVACWDRGSGESDAGFRAQAAAADIGVSIADLGVCSSGSMLFVATGERPRSVTLLPRSHVAILTADSLVPDLESALASLAARGSPASSALFVTGPSRTSDIENDLTLGVHGPAAVTVFLLDS